MIEKQHILFINHSREFHGAERIMIQSMRAAKETGAQVTVVVPNLYQDKGFEQEAQKWADTILHLPYRGAGISLKRTIGVIIYNLFATLKLYCYAKKENVTCIYSNTFQTILGVIAAHHLHLPHIWHFHEMPHPEFAWQNNMRFLYKHWTQYVGNKVIFISQAQQNAWNTIMRKSINNEIIYNPICPLELQKKEEHTNIRIGYLGSFEKRKNLQLLVQVMDRILSEYPNVELWLCGAQTDRDSLISSRERTYILPATKDVASYYAKLDIFVLPSLYETMPLVVLEAMQAGVCVIQTNQSGLVELLEDTKDCFFFSPNNANTLESIIRKCLDSAIRTKIAMQGQAKVQSLMQQDNYLKQIQTVLNVR